MTLSTTPSFKPKTAMVLAAGLGKRMRPITSTIPKPLVEIRGKALIDYGLDALARNGVERVVVDVARPERGIRRGAVAGLVVGQEVGARGETRAGVVGRIGAVAGHRSGRGELSGERLGARLDARQR